MGVAALVVLIGLAACAEEECSPNGPYGSHCEGSVLVTCSTQGILFPSQERYERNCANEGLGCVDTNRSAVCAAREPACTVDDYCDGDTLVHCDPELPGYTSGKHSCAPYPCVHVDGGEPALCVEPETQCFKRPDGQYCWQYSDEAFECLKGGKVRTNKQCPRCYVDEAGKAASRETNAPCL